MPTERAIQYTDEMVGDGHPSKTDTLNRLVKCLLNDYGGFYNGTAFPSIMPDGGSLEDRAPFYRSDLNALFAYDLTNTRWRAVGAPIPLDNNSAILVSGAASTMTDVDSSSKCPAGATWAVCDAMIAGTGTIGAAYLLFKAKGASNTQAIATESFGTVKESQRQVWIPLDSNRIFQYQIIPNVDTATVTLYVRGWL